MTLRKPTPPTWRTLSPPMVREEWTKRKKCREAGKGEQITERGRSNGDRGIGLTEAGIFLSPSAQMCNVYSIKIL